MVERDTDRLLSELFKLNAPRVNEAVLLERVSEKLPSGRRWTLRARYARSLAVAATCMLLLVGMALGALRLVDYLNGPVLVFGDSLPADGSRMNPVLVGLTPFVGTAILEQTKSEGIVSSTGASSYPTQVTGQVSVYSLDTSRAGIGGTLEIDADLNVRADGSADIKGSWILRDHTGQGSWECDSWAGYRNADGGEEFGFGRAAGAGAFEGLTLYLQWRSTVGQGLDPAAAKSVVVTGWIQSAD